MRIEARDPHFAKDYKKNPYTWVPVTLMMRLKLRLTGHCSLNRRTKPGWAGYSQFFLVKCSKCKEYFIDYKHGHTEYFFCPTCNPDLND